MAGTANLVRTEEDFSGSIYPGSRGHRGAGRPAAAVRRNGAAISTECLPASVARTRSSALGEISVLTSGYGGCQRGRSRVSGVLGPTPHGLFEQHGGGARGRPVPHPVARRELTQAPGRNCRTSGRPLRSARCRSRRRHPTKSRRRTAGSRASSTRMSIRVPTRPSSSSWSRTPTTC